MKFPLFELERWLSEYRFKCDIDLSSSVITHIKYNEIISERDLDMPIKIGPTNGIEELRQEISRLYSGAISAENVLITHGAAEANFLVLNSLISPGDECIFLVPNYMQAKGILEAIGAKVKLAWLDEKRNYHLNLEEINELTSEKTKAILITNPNNPTGVRLTLKELEGICEIAQSVGAYVIADEVLSGLEIDGERTVSPVEIYEKGISTRSLSKFGLSGLRVGWIVARDPTIVQRCWSLKDYTSLGNSFFNQYIATIALKKLDVIKERNRKILSRGVEILMDVVNKNKDIISYVKPQAGSTTLIRYKPSISSVEYCKRLAQSEGVAVAPGDYFGASQRFRILYGTTAEKLEEGLQKIIKFTRSLA